IIDRQTFDRVQEILKFHKRMSAKQKAKIEYLLTGKAFCGYCGASLVGVSGTSRDGSKHYYYTCSNRWKKHSCKKNNEKKDFLEKYVVGQTLNYILTDENIEKISTAFLEIWNKSDVKIKIDNLQKQISQIENDIDKCFNSFVIATNEDLQKRLNEKAESLTVHKKDLQSEIEKLKFTQELTKSKDDVKNLLHKFLNENVNDINFQREIIFNFVNCVYIFDDKILIYYNLFDNKKITFDDVLNDLKEQNSNVQIFDNMGSQTKFN
ncbi:MAG: zinc ribbon domain-containing protein, partial [Christensenellales bacterium]